MNYCFDSAKVQALKDRLNDPELLRGGDWAKLERSRLHKQIRAQRLAEARERGTHTAEQWQEVLERYDFRCVRCGCLPIGRPCKDHITPIYMGGSDGVDNLQPMCRECNSSKGPDTFNWRSHRDEQGFSEDCDA